MMCGRDSWNRLGAARKGDYQLRPRKDGGHLRPVDHGAHRHQERRQAAPDETTSTLSVQASRKALEMAGTQAPRSGPDHLLHDFAGHAAAFHRFIHSARAGRARLLRLRPGRRLLGVSFRPDRGRQFIKTGKAKYVLVIGAELLSRYLDYTGPRHLRHLRRRRGGGGLRARRAALGNPGRRDAHRRRVRRPPLHSCRRHRPAGQLRHRRRARALHQDARQRVVQGGGSQPGGGFAPGAEEGRRLHDQIDLFIPHQANQRITDAVRERLGVPPEKVYSNISRVGNTSSASIPICLDECVRAGRIKKGDLILMSAFGAGVTWGAVLMRW